MVEALTPGDSNFLGFAWICSLFFSSCSCPRCLVWRFGLRHFVVRVWRFVFVMGHTNPGVQFIGFCLDCAVLFGESFVRSLAVCSIVSSALVRRRDGNLGRVGSLASTGIIHRVTFLEGRLDKWFLSAFSYVCPSRRVRQLVVLRLVRGCDACAVSWSRLPLGADLSLQCEC